MHLRVEVAQGDVKVTGEALVTVTDRLDAALSPAAASARWLPGYTFERAAGELWRSRFDAERNKDAAQFASAGFNPLTRSRTTAGSAALNA